MEGRKYVEKSNMLLADWILRSRHAFSVVEDEGFRELLRHVSGNRYSPLHRAAIKKKVLLNFKQQQALVRAYFAARRGLRPCAILDLWKSAGGQHYLGIALSFIDEEWRQWAIALAVPPVNTAHTSENIHELVTSVLDEFNIVPQCFVADNTASQVRANDLLADWANSKEADADSDSEDIVLIEPDEDLLEKVRLNVAFPQFSSETLGQSFLFTDRGNRLPLSPLGARYQARITALQL